MIHRLAFHSARQDALLQAFRSPPPQNETTDTGSVDRYQREQAYDRTHIARDDRAFANRLLHRLTEKRALPKQGCPSSSGAAPKSA
jgi:hypothetical protein